MHMLHGIRKPKCDWSAALGSDARDCDHRAPGQRPSLRKSHNPQLYLAHATPLQRRRPGECQEHRGQERDGSMARTEHDKRQQQPRPTTTSNEAPTPAETPKQHRTDESVERCGCDVREYEKSFGKTLDDDVKIGVILSLAPASALHHCHLSS